MEWRDVELKSGLAFANCKDFAALNFAGSTIRDIGLLGQARTSGCHRSPALSKSRSGRGSRGAKRLQQCGEELVQGL